jgi:signal transduction histidine kinase/ActR/RegA family two-component response regulator
MRSALLESEILQSRAEHDLKDARIESLENQLRQLQLQSANKDIAFEETIIAKARDDSFSSRDAVEEIHRWLFLRGGQMEDVPSMLSEYSEKIRELGIPLDRLFIGGLMLHPQVSAYVWKWEVGTNFEEHEIPPHVFSERKKRFSPNEPFTVLNDGRASRVRMRSADGNSPPKDCQWFHTGGYHDYLALPILRRGEFKGAVAWSTKDVNGFSPGHIEFFEQSMAALSTVMRLHTNDLVTKTLMGRLEEEVAERTKELAAANDSLAQANRLVERQAKTQLQHFAMMSHEIRTPLSGIIGLSSLLEQTDLNEEQHESVRMIVTSGDLLVRVVNDVLDYAKLASGKAEVELTSIVLDDVLKPVVGTMQVKAAQRQVTIEAKLEDDLPPLIYSDGRRLQQIMYNLLGNAVKFSKKGCAVEFSVSRVSSPSGDAGLRLLIKDYGNGIRKEDFGKLFQPFGQVGVDTERDHGGTGLGLAITSKLVGALGGTISVDSDFGHWCTFTVDLPVGTPTNMDSLSRSESDSSSACIKSQSLDKTWLSATKPAPSPGLLIEPSDPGSLKVLIAEDNQLNRKLLRRLLAKIGVNDVGMVDNGLKAVEKSSKIQYDLILMDMQMPVMDGLEATRLIKKHYATNPVASPKVVFVSAHALSEYNCQALEAGADGFIAKPYKISSIASLVEATVLSKRTVP